MPRLRFPGFEGEWGWELGSELLRIVNDKPYQIQASEYHDHGRFEVVDQGKNAIVGYSDMEEKLFTSIPIIVFGDHTTTVKYRDRPFIVGGDGVKLLASCSDKISLKYLFYALLRYGPKVEGYKRHYTMLKEKSIPIPLKNEQEALAYLLSLIDYRITAQRKLVELLKKHKRGVIEQIFGRRLDMGKDAEKWDIVELRDLFSKVARRNRDGKVKNVITNSAEFGLIPQRNFFDKSIAVDGNTDGYYVIRTGDFVYNPRKSMTAPFGPFNRYTGIEDGIISPLYTCLVPKGKANPEYLAWYFRSTAWHRYVYDNGSQGARHDRVNMTDDLLFGIPVLLPSIAVQERIADGLNAIDARWSSANKVLAHLEKMKHGLLQQLFA